MLYCFQPIKTILNSKITSLLCFANVTFVSANPEFLLLIGWITWYQPCFSRGIILNFDWKNSRFWLVEIRLTHFFFKVDAHYYISRFWQMRRVRTRFARALRVISTFPVEGGSLFSVGFGNLFFRNWHLLSLSKCWIRFTWWHRAVFHNF